MKNKYLIPAVAAGSLAVVATLIITLGSETAGSEPRLPPATVQPHMNHANVPHATGSQPSTQPTPSIQQGAPGQAGSPQRVAQPSAPQRSVAYEQEQPDPTQDPLMPPKQKPLSEQPPEQRQLADDTQSSYMPPIQQPMPSYGSQQQQIDERQINQGQAQQEQPSQTNPEIQTAPRPVTPNLDNAPSSFQPANPVIQPTPTPRVQGGN